jgi:hypothetical protein
MEATLHLMKESATIIFTKCNNSIVHRNISGLSGGEKYLAPTLQKV